MLARNVTRGAVVASGVCVARSWWSRLRGLMLAPELRPGEGLLILRCRSIHTHFMRFPIDALFLDGEGRVVAAAEAMRPWRISRHYAAARDVLELPAGTIAATGTRSGDRVSIEDPDARAV